MSKTKTNFRIKYNKNFNIKKIFTYKKTNYLHIILVAMAQLEVFKALIYVMNILCI